MTVSLSFKPPPVALSANPTILSKAIKLEAMPGALLQLDGFIHIESTHVPCTHIFALRPSALIADLQGLSRMLLTQACTVF